MKKYLVYSILLITGLFCGIIFLKYEIFPYGYIKTTYHELTQEPYGPWAIGIYEGTTPFNLSDPKDISNPVLTPKDIDDVDATFVADPFMLFKNGKYSMFFEVLNRSTNQGDIGYAVSDDGKHWDYKNIIIDEKFHLSYPYVFEWDDNYYLIPESHEDFSVRLYKATTFPDKWEYIGNLLSGYRFLDPSIFRYKDKWWMFVGTGNNDILNLYYSEDLLTGWTPHPMNPIIKSNKNISRPGGRVIVYNDKLYRFTQDCDPSYGVQVFAFEIVTLTETTYLEKIVKETPIVTKSGSGWNASGMHHVDPHKIDGKWISTVDGRNR